MDMAATQPAEQGNPDVRTHLRLCPFCEQNCGTVVKFDHKAKRIISIRGDKDDPFSKGYICAKAYAQKELSDDPDRLRTPMIKRNGVFEPATWPEALDFTADKIKGIQAKYGKSAIAFYFGNAISHIPGPTLYAASLLTALETTQIYSSASIDHFPQMLAAMEMFGGYAAFPIPDIDRTDYFVLVGTNPSQSNGSLMTAPGVQPRLDAIQARGGKVVFIDPRKSESASTADWHLPVRPGGDAALMFGVLHTLFAEGLTKLGKLQGQVKGLAELEQMAREFPPERVAASCGITAADIRKLAREFAAAKTACLYGRVGSTSQEFGSLANWLMWSINVVTGNLDREGGMMFPRGAFEAVLLSDRYQGDVAPYNRWQSRVRGAPEIAYQLPAAVMAEEMEVPGEGQVKAFITMCANPAVSAQNGGGRLSKAMEQLEFMLSFDIYINESSRHADVILPSPDHMEHSDFMVYFITYCVRDYVRYCPPVTDLAAGALQDSDIINGLVARILGITPDQAEERALNLLYEQLKAQGNPVCNSIDYAEIRKSLGDAPGQDRMLDLLLRSSRDYGDHFGARPDGLTLQRLKAQPHGVDLGPMQSRLAEAIYLPHKKVELMPQIITADIPNLRQWIDAGTTDGLTLISGRRHVRSCNSWMHNLHVLVKGKDRCTLVMHPQDAQKRGITDKAMVEVRTLTGAVKVRAELSEDIRPGVVSLPHGWGHDEPGTRMQIAGEHAGVNANLLSGIELLDRPSGNAVFNGIPVEVLALEKISTRIAQATTA
jgi:anaerobic selenocysteine-containing dehydrogenase